jgi:hypothetical protein
LIGDHAAEVAWAPSPAEAKFSTGRVSPPLASLRSTHAAVANTDQMVAVLTVEVDLVGLQDRVVHVEE